MTTCTVHAVEQRSEEWFRLRLGRLTGSRANDALKTIKSGEAAGRKKLRVQMVLERLTGRSQESPYVSPAMQTGIERELEARELYEAQTGVLVQSCGFLSHPDLMTGCSLDGYVGDFDGICEIKSPEPHTHLEYLTTGRVPLDYERQMLHSLWLSGAAWCDWFSYHPDFPESLRIKLIRIQRDDAAIKAYEALVKTFLEECDREYALIAKLAERAA